MAFTLAVRPFPSRTAPALLRRRFYLTCAKHYDRLATPVSIVHDDTMTDADGFDLQKYKNEVSGMIVTELFQIVNNERKMRGEEFSKELVLSIICSIIATIINRTLEPLAQNSPGRRSNASVQEYAVLKLALENAVAAAFTGAFLSFDPKNTPEFVCQVNKVGPSPSKASH